MRHLIPFVLLIGCATPTEKSSAPSDTGSSWGSSSVDPDGTTGSGDAPGPGDDCEGGGVLDCGNECWVADARDYIGDGICDTGQRGPDFSCVQFEYDSGDCEPGAETTGSGGDTGSAGGEEAGGEETGAVEGGEETGAVEGGEETGAAEGGEETGGEGSGGAETGGGTTGSGVSVWECDVEGPFGAPAPGAYDCREICVSLIYHEYAAIHPAGLWMDGNCDDAGPGEYADFNCPKFASDYGDCFES